MSARPQTGAEALLVALKRCGVDHIFANSGTDFPPIIEALARGASEGLDMPRAITVTHESVAVAMAHGHYLVSGKPQAAMLHTNVGLANAVMGVINASSDRVPMILCSGRTPITERGRFGSRDAPIHWGQEMYDQAGMIRERVKWDYEMRYAEQAASLVSRALSIATSAPEGPVYLSLPREPLAEPVPENWYDAPVQPAATAPFPDPAAAQAAAAMIASAENPLIVAQKPAARSSFEPLASFAERWAIPVVEFWATRNALSADHPMHGGYALEPWLAEADLVLLLDAMVPWSPAGGGVRPELKAIHLSADPLFSDVPMRQFPADLHLTGDPAASLAAIEAAMPGTARPDAETIEARRRRVTKTIAALRGAALRKVEDGARSPMSSGWVGRCLAQALGPEARYFCERGVPPESLCVTQPGRYFSHAISGGLGWALPAALGAQLADPESLNIAVIGDGCYIFANPVACHQVAEAHRLPILTVILNNASWGAVRHATRGMYPEGAAVRANAMPLTDLSPMPGFAAIAAASRAHAERVTDARELPNAVQRCLDVIRNERRQALLDVHIAPGA